MSFDHLIGNREIKDILKSAISSNKVTHSYLFIGPSGIGKTLFAKEFAKMILCTADNKPCIKCKSCIEFDENNQPDFHIIEPEDGIIKIDTIRKMQTKVFEKPIISEKKVYLIKDADLMTKEAQNCLLKTLEEPPSYVTIILIGANESMFLNTIRSRCMKILFHKIGQEELTSYLQHKCQFNNISEELIKACDGSIEKAIRIYEKKEMYQEIQEVFSNVEKYHLLDVLGKLDCLYKNKENIEEILEYITILFYSKAIQDTKYIEYIKEIEQVKRNLKINSNYDMSIDKLLYKIWEELD